MTTTTDPRNVRFGRVIISATSKAKRDALIGRTAIVKRYDGSKFTGTITAIEGIYAIATDESGKWMRTDRVVLLAETV